MNELWQQSRSLLILRICSVELQNDEVCDTTNDDPSLAQDSNVAGYKK